MIAESILSKIPSPAYVIEETKFDENLRLLQKVRAAAGVKIILALKAFANWQLFPLVGTYLSGATASSLNEARLINEEMGVKAHTYAVAYPPQDFEKILKYSSHLTFNSVSQFLLHRSTVARVAPSVSCGIRINPEYSPVATALYNPAAAGSRLGVQAAAFQDGLPEGVEGLHFHTLCESSAKDLEATLQVVEQKFGKWLPQLKWLNMGGGHLITRKDYDTDHLIQLLRAFKIKYPNLEIILEPGSAIAWRTGFLLATVLDIVNNAGVQTAVLDISFTAHAPDTLEMPYRPAIVGASDPVEGKPTYQLGGVSCLAGDYLAPYSFNRSLAVGDSIVFEDMIHYTMVKTTMFNGVKHPNIVLLKSTGEIDVLRQFDYQDYKRRMS